MRPFIRVGLGALLLVTACRGTGATGVTAGQLTDLIAAQVMAPLHQMAPDLALGPVRCPPVQQIAGEAHGRCGLVVDGRELAVDVWRDGAQVAAQLLATGIDVTNLERYHTDDEAPAGEPPTVVDCGSPKIRMFAVDDVITCTATRPGWSHVWKIRVENLRGRISFPNGYPSRPDAQADPRIARLDPLLRDPNRVVDGADVERMVHEMFPRDFPRPLGAAHCPPKVDLADGHWQFCTIAVDGQPLRVRVDAANGGWNVYPDQALIDVSQLEKAASASAEAKVRSHNVRSPPLPVHCAEKGLVIRELPVHLRCQMDMGDTSPQSVHAFVFGSRPTQTMFYFGDPPELPNENAYGNGGVVPDNTAAQSHAEAQARATAQPAGALGLKYFWQGVSDRLNREVAVLWFDASKTSLADGVEPLMKRYAPELGRTRAEVLLLKGISGGSFFQTGGAFIFVKDHNGKWSRNEDKSLTDALVVAGY